MGILTDMTLFTNNLLTYQQIIFLYGNGSWFSTNMDRENPIVLKTKENTFVFKEVLDLEKRGIDLNNYLVFILLYNFFKCGFALYNLWNTSVVADFFLKALRTEAEASCNTK